MELLHSGKVRDVYSDGGDLILVASDRVSVYDVVLPTPVPDKGRVLTRLSSWWFARLADLVPNHVISTTDVPAEFAGRAVRCRRLLQSIALTVEAEDVLGRQNAQVRVQRLGPAPVQVMPPVDVGPCRLDNRPEPIGIHAIHCAGAVAEG